MVSVVAFSLVSVWFRFEIFVKMASLVRKLLVTRASVGVENDTFVKRLEEGAPVAEEGTSGTEESVLV